MRPQQVVHNCYTPEETVELCSRAGVKKVNMRIDKIFFSAFMAGALLAFACAATLSTEAAPWYQENAPGLIRMLGALIFPWGLVAIVVTGADLVTGSFMFSTLPCIHRRVSPLKMVRHWVLCFFGNLAGSLFVVGLVCGEGGVFSIDSYKTEAINFATMKAVTPQWHMIFLRAIGANWLVCLACFLSMMAREYISKVAAIWWPTFAFVCLGFDHVVANMFFIPIGIYCGAPGITVGYYIWKSMIPALLGNAVGGSLFVSLVYWYLYVQGSSHAISVDGEHFEGDMEPLVGQEQNENEKTNGEEPSAGQKKSAENMV